MNLARVGVLIDQIEAEKYWSYGLNIFNKYIKEVLSHAGIDILTINSMEELKAINVDVVYAVLVKEDKKYSQKLKEYIEQGGTVISFNGLNVLMNQLGFTRQRSVGIGYATLPENYDVEKPLRFLDANPLLAKKDAACENFGLITKKSPRGSVVGPLIQKIRIGEGKIERWSVNVVESIVGFQQGTKPIFEDGIPAKDGTGKVNDGVLKKDDGVTLDWETDRVTTATGQKFFPTPFGDLWREVIVTQLLQIVVNKGKTIPFTGYWPEGVSGVAMISHDSDANQVVHAESTLKVLDELGIHTSWCMFKRGYSPETHQQVIEAGHELGFHYNARPEEDGFWGAEHFDEQFKVCQEVTGLEKITSNKNHYTRFEGWGELYQWCEKNGIEADQTSGPSKNDNTGFLYGTCQPFFPIAWSDEKNRLYNVVELCYVGPDIPAWSDYSIVQPCLQQVKQVEGVAHFLFHQDRIHNDENIRNSMRDVVKDARELGFQFWTGKQINDWVRKRRAVEIKRIDNQSTVEINNPQEAKNLVIWVPVPKGVNVHGEVKKKFGVNCLKRVVS